MFSLICVWINGWVNNREAGDLRRYCAHYDVIVMQIPSLLITCQQREAGHQQPYYKPSSLEILWFQHQPVSLVFNSSYNVDGGHQHITISSQSEVNELKSLKNVWCLTTVNYICNIFALIYELKCNTSFTTKINQCMICTGPTALIFPNSFTGRFNENFILLQFSSWLSQYYNFCDQFTRIRIITKWNFHRIWITAKRSVLKWALANTAMEMQKYTIVETGWRKTIWSLLT